MTAAIALWTLFLAVPIALLLGWAGGRGGASAALRDIRRGLGEVDADIGAIQQNLSRLNGRKGREVAKEHESMPDAQALLMQMLLNKVGGKERDEGPGFVGSAEELMGRNGS